MRSVRRFGLSGHIIGSNVQQKLRSSRNNETQRAKPPQLAAASGDSTLCRAPLISSAMSVTRTECVIGSIATENEIPPFGASQRRIKLSARSGEQDIKQITAARITRTPLLLTKPATFLNFIAIVFVNAEASLKLGYHYFSPGVRTVRRPGVLTSSPNYAVIESGDAEPVCAVVSVCD
jgi:hypothetical protein